MGADYSWQNNIRYRAQPWSFYHQRTCESLVLPITPCWFDRGFHPRYSWPSWPALAPRRPTPTTSSLSRGYIISRSGLLGTIGCWSCQRSWLAFLSGGSQNDFWYHPPRWVGRWSFLLKFTVTHWHQVWPNTLVSCALFNTLHSQSYAGVGRQEGLSRERYFTYAFVTAVVWCTWRLSMPLIS